MGNEKISQSSVAQGSLNTEAIHQMIYRRVYKAVEHILGEQHLTGTVWLATQQAAEDIDAAQPPAAPVDLTNHHNALKCPYCNPKGLKFAEPAAPVETVLPSQHRDASKWPSKADMEASHSRSSAATGGQEG